MNHQNATLLEIADQCVKCGLCLPYCPSYRQYQNEADSPRGRIALLQGLMTGSVSPSDRNLQKHLDQCLNCGNCEPACPSGVKFAELIEKTRINYEIHGTAKWQLSLLASARTMRIATTIGRMVPDFVSLFAFGFINKLLQNRPVRNASIKSASLIPASGTQLGTVAVFTGCSGSVVDAPAIDAAAGLLSQMGYRVFIPPEQVCCGALHYHEGYAEQAEHFAQENQAVFNTLQPDAIIYFASGCGAHLAEHSPFQAPLFEATQFLHQILKDKNLRLQSSETQSSVVLHCPCSLRNKTDAWPATLELISRMTGGRAVELPDNLSCCGGAGLHLIKHHDTAKQMIAPKIAALKTLHADVLLTSNTGCALHFGNAIKAAQLPTRVMHPAEWISEQLAQASKAN